MSICCMGAVVCTIAGVPVVLVVATFAHFSGRGLPHHVVWGLRAAPPGASWGTQP